MDKTRDLEKRWYRYKYKKIISLLLYFFASYAVLAGSYYAFLNWNKLSNVFSKKSAPQELSHSIPLVEEQKKNEENRTVEKPLEEKKEIRTNIQEELSLEPVIPIIDMEKEKRKDVVKATTRREQREKTTSHRVQAKPSTYLTKTELSGVKKQEGRDTTRLKKIHLRSSSKNYIETITKKFLKSKNPREALLLAKAFYREGNYQNAEKWALTANKLDALSDESWILFAKSKAKMGKKNEAIKILVAYYKKTKSNKIRAVIEKIQAGKI